MYKHHKCGFLDALAQMCEFIQSNVPKNSGASLLVLGDFNVDFNKQEEEQKKNIIQNKVGFTPLFTNEKTFQYKTQIDWAFKTRQFNHNIDIQVYDTWFSDHSAIYSQINFAQ